MAGILAMFGGSMVSGLLGPVLGMIPNDPNSSVTNPYAGMTSTGGNSVGAPMMDMFGNFLGYSGSSTSTGNTGVQSGYYMETPSTAPTTTTTSTSPIDTNTLLIGGAIILAVVLIK